MLEQCARNSTAYSKISAPPKAMTVKNSRRTHQPHEKVTATPNTAQVPGDAYPTVIRKGTNMHRMYADVQPQNGREATNEACLGCHGVLLISNPTTMAQGPKTTHHPYTRYIYRTPYPVKKKTRGQQSAPETNKSVEIRAPCLLVPTRKR